jgi:phage baseplate assembly protein V
MLCMNADIAELSRRLENLIRLGTIIEVDGALARVKSGQLETQWLSWLTHRAGNAVTWWQPSVGEQVMLLSPGGFTESGIILPAIYSDQHPAPSVVSDLHTTHYPDGAVIEYDHAAHALAVALPAGGSAVLTAPASVTVISAAIKLDAPETTCTGNLTVQNKLTYLGGMVGSGDAGSGKAANIAGDITINGKSFDDHVHLEQGDGAPTSAPL